MKIYSRRVKRWQCRSVKVVKKWFQHSVWFLIVSIANVLLASLWWPIILACVLLQMKSFTDTFWRPHFSIWRLKKKFWSPVGACWKKLISDPVCQSSSQTLCGELLQTHGKKNCGRCIQHFWVWSLNKQQMCGARMNKGGIKPSIELKK